MDYNAVTVYSEDELLQLSGLQHFAFCPRQWALIHIEGQWSENVLTMGGRHLHQRVDNPLEVEKRGDLIVARSVPVASRTLGLSGTADLVEFRQVRGGEEANGVALPGHFGRWLPCPVEYKRGRPKKDDRDAVQLGAQGMCLEEMMGVSIMVGDLFYGETRHRLSVPIDQELRGRVENLAVAMHALFKEGKTPPADSGKNCRLCSIIDLCLPKLTRKRQTADAYIRRCLEETGI